MKEQRNKLTLKDIVIRGTLIAIIVVTPSLTAFFLSWLILNDLIQAAIIGGIIHFIALGFTLKISKKFFVKKRD